MGPLDSDNAEENEPPRHEDTKEGTKQTIRKTKEGAID
jgi:hypothetical protein